MKLKLLILLLFCQNENPCKKTYSKNLLWGFEIGFRK